MSMGSSLFIGSFSLSEFLILLFGYSCSIAPVIFVVIRKYLSKKRDKDRERESQSI